MVPCMCVAIHCPRACMYMASPHPPACMRATSGRPHASVRMARQPKHACMRPAGSHMSSDVSQRPPACMHYASPRPMHACMHFASPRPMHACNTLPRGRVHGTGPPAARTGAHATTALHAANRRTRLDPFGEPPGAVAAAAVAARRSAGSVSTDGWGVGGRRHASWYSRIGATLACALKGSNRSSSSGVGGAGGSSGVRGGSTRSSTSGGSSAGDISFDSGIGANKSDVRMEQLQALQHERNMSTELGELVQTAVAPCKNGSV
eukprot:364609-Chlamydomonas_euryale.AAC.2